MKVIRLLCIAMFFCSGCLIAMKEEEPEKTARISDCDLAGLQKYFPNNEMIKSLEALFSLELRERITDVKKDLQPFLIAKGFRILQFPYSSTSAVVVEHPSIEGYVLKFVRDPYEAVAGKFKKRFKITKKRSLAMRAINADKLNTFIKEHQLKYVKVPKKYFYCIGQFPVLIAEKMSIQSPRPFDALNENEIREILDLVAFSQGILDLYPRNIILSDKYVFFIDTERQEEPAAWQAMIFESLKAFREAVAPQYRALIDDWYAKVITSEAEELLKTKKSEEKQAIHDLERAVKNQRLDDVKQLFKKHIYPQLTIDKLLFKAVESRNVPMVDFLLEKGAGTTKRNNRGQTVIDLAKEQENIEMLNHLLRSCEATKE